MANIGDKIEIVMEKGTEKGILMPSPDEKVVLIKLDNGYNIGFEKKDVEEIKVIENKKEKEAKPKKPVSTDKNLKTISILHCGGTIASKVDYETGAVKAKFSPEELLEMFPELGEIVNLKSRLVANMMSENIRFAHYNIIAKEIEKEIKAGSEGIIITHGTDTLHYTAAALAFALENLNVPVLLVGAQRSSDRGSSDAFFNLKCAAYFAVKSDFAEVGICMHNSASDDNCAIIPGVRGRKMHSSRRDAFKAVNSHPFALVDGGGNIEWIRRDYNKRSGNKSDENESKNKKMTLKLFKENIKVGLLKAHPQMFVEEIKSYGHFAGLVLEGTGLGHFPIEKQDDFTQEHELIYKEIADLAKKIPVVMTTQTIFGGVNMNVYSPGRRLLEAGVLGNGLDMTSETSFIKLAWLLSNYPLKDTKELLSKNLRGEISTQRKYETVLAEEVGK